MHSKRIVDVQGSPMEVLLFEPPGAGPHPGVVVCQHIPTAHRGLETDPWQIEVGDRLAAAGFMVAMPFTFHWWPAEADIDIKRKEFRDDRCVADLQAAQDLLAGLPGVDPARLGILGHCWGGRVAWLGACHLRSLKAAVVLYGGRIRLPMADGATPPIELADRIGCPVLGLFGNEDANPSPQDVDAYAAALAAAGVAHEFHRYDGAGHGFQDTANAERYRHEQSEDAWGRIVGFLGRALGAADRPA